MSFETQYAPTKLADICTDISYGYTASAASENVGPKFLRITDIQGGVVSWHSVPHCVIGVEQIPKYLLIDGDIVVARTGNSTGENYIFTGSEKAVFASYLIRFRVNHCIADPFYVWYQMRSSAWQSFVNSSKTGSAQAGANAKVLGGFDITLPSLNLQRQIASFLRLIDNSISLLHETNTTLEAIAQTLFKSWFVDFDPVKAKAEGRLPEGMDEATAALFPSEFEVSALGLIPKGWSNVSLKEVVSIFDSQRVPLSGGDRAKRKGNYPYYGAASLMDYVDGYIFDGVYCLMGEDGSVAHESGYPIMQYVWGKIWVNNHAHVLQGKNGISTEHVMLSLQRTNIQPLITGAVQAKLSQGNMWRIVFLMPTRSIAEVFGEMIAPLFTRIRHNFEKIQTLTTLRDTLLPRLISGQIRLNQAQELVDEVTA